MNYIVNTSLFFLAFILLACNNHHPDIDKESELVFPKGEKLISNNFTGTAWFAPLIASDSLNFNAVGNVIFEPGARTNWHFHPAGQIILAISGVGYYQEKGSPMRTLHKGDAVKCPPNIPHWHGASPDQEFVQIAITGRALGPTEWLEPVTDEEYNSIK